MLGLILGLALAQATDIRIIQVAARDLPPGTTLRYADFEGRPTPARFVPDHVVADPEQALGSTTREWIYQGENLRTERLDPPGGPTGLLAALPRGMRLVEVAQPGPRPWPRPGDTLDLVHPTEACTLAASVPVLGVRAVHGQVQTERAKDDVDHAWVAVLPTDLPALLAVDPPRLLLHGPDDPASTVLPRCEGP